MPRLRWAQRVLVIDSGSTDDTLALIAQFPNVQVLHRPFDSFAEQCNFGLQHISSEWVLSMDADYVLDIRVRDLEAFAAFMHQDLLPHPQVAQVRSEIVLKTLKDGEVLDLRG